MSSFCQQCGNQVNDEALFCGKCGKPLKTLTAVPQQAPQDGTPPKVSATAENVKPINKTNSAGKYVKSLDYILYITGSILSVIFLFVYGYINSAWADKGSGKIVMWTNTSYKLLLHDTNLTALFLIGIIGSLALLVGFSFTKNAALKIVFSSIAPFILIIGTIAGVAADDDFHVGIIKYGEVCRSVYFGVAFYFELILLFGMLTLAILNANGKHLIKTKSKAPIQPVQPYQQVQFPQQAPPNQQPQPMRQEQPFQQVQSNQEAQSVIHTQAVQSAQPVKPSEQE